jgi:hypothetical protein
MQMQKVAGSVILAGTENVSTGWVSGVAGN